MNHNNKTENERKEKPDHIIIDNSIIHNYIIIDNRIRETVGRCTSKENVLGSGTYGGAYLVNYESKKYVLKVFQYEGHNLGDSRFNGMYGFSTSYK